ncbi:hypothetical protein [Kaistella jeonii]|uniref:Uncharacterized protein n=1 Tax=Kaistella jeonii TaxID=266749 RepID=A0A0C1F715_9FLAO|nr:hypothetical protein [Kaistella jeonii]KIA88992.1 hypothetical protein OA86_07890 [Kaistella jeonii]SFB97213.1 UDP-N-acetylmuramate: L-alanyl-gamma-D-glutamyl-meso-diaminopimelate ligase [Kaistella jeonii]VEI97215.1 Uncharacterised protein [Kaistella jeonii]
MISFPALLDYSKEKTRVLIYTSNPSIAKLVVEVLNFSCKEFDFFLEDGLTKNDDNDFVIFETSDIEKASQFKPTIFFISKEINSENIDPALRNITPGGILIYPSELETIVEECPHYFRKLPFQSSVFQKNTDQFVLSTEMGPIPVISRDEHLIKNLEGIKLLCQQFGVMEEEFYEPMMSFE